jgi:hypothetical protein
LLDSLDARRAGDLGKEWARVVVEGIGSQTLNHRDTETQRNNGTQKGRHSAAHCDSPF